MIITNSTPDEYYFNQLIAFIMSMKINSPEHVKMMKIYLSNYTDDLVSKLKNSFPEITFVNNNLHMIDQRGFGTIVDRSKRILECFDEYKENVIWLDTDILVRANLSDFIKIDPEELKILYRKDSPIKVRFNAGVFNIGYSEITRNLIKDWYKRIKVGKRWGAGQLELWNAFQKYKKKIKMTNIGRKYNSAGDHFEDDYIIWHCKMAHFEKPKYQGEYQRYLKKAKNYIGEINN